jgi:hypothetical protein
MVSKTSALALGLGLVLVLAFGMAAWTPEAPVAAADVQISKEQFARYLDEWPEAEGFFDSDNFISNETSYLHVVNELREQVLPGGIYIGVGPDQNFSYIAHTRPALAIVIDIRRQNMLQHLLFKALLDRASSRAEYLALLFARETPAVTAGASVKELLGAIRMAPSTPGIFERNIEWVKETLLHTYGLKLSSDDLDKIEYTYKTFAAEGLDLRFSTIGRLPSYGYPRYEELLLETDREGNYQSFVSSEELFLWLKQFEAENRLIPVVGDFAGQRAFKNVAGFLKQNGLQVSAFYTSNVEFYLFGRREWRTYLDNVRALPVSDNAVFIRSYFPSFGRIHPLNVAGHRSTSLVQPLVPLLEADRAGRISSYWDVVRGAR